MAVTYKLIETVTVGSGGAASIAFASIPQTYTDLQLVVSGRSTASNPGYARFALFISFNGSSANFTGRDVLGGSGSTNSTSFSNGRIGFINANDASANAFSSTSVIIPNYTGSTNKSFGTDFANENNNTNETSMGLVAGLWSITSAITALSLSIDIGYNFAQYSSASLYGIKNS